MGLAFNKQILGPKMGLDARLDAGHGTLSKQKECLFGVQSLNSDNNFGWSLQKIVGAQPHFIAFGDHPDYVEHLDLLYHLDYPDHANHPDQWSSWLAWHPIPDSD